VTNYGDKKDCCKVITNLLKRRSSSIKNA